MEYQTEADALEDQSDGGASEWFHEQEQERYYTGLSKKQRAYQRNRDSELGTTIECANCGRRILKKSYQTQFCSNKGKGNCKDTYWNNVGPSRRARANVISRGVNPSSARGQYELFQQETEYLYGEDE